MATLGQIVVFNANGISPDRHVFDEKLPVNKCMNRLSEVVLDDKAAFIDGNLMAAFIFFSDIQKAW